MKRAATYALVVLTMVAASGTLMRAMPWWRVDWPYENIRHAHSHLGFLGWLFSAYVLVLFQFFLPKEKAWSRDKQQWFYAAVVTAVLMFLAFLWRGYKAPAVALLTVHTGIAYVLLAKVWRESQVADKSSGWFLKAAIFFFFLSSLGPFAIPFIRMVGDGSTESVRLAVHFYLHFQYSGWFVFGFLAMIYRYLELQGEGIPKRVAGIHLVLAGSATLPLYFLTAPSLNEAISRWYRHLSWVVDAGPWWQLAATIMFIFFAWRQWPSKSEGPRWLPIFALSVLATKVLLEWLVFSTPMREWLKVGNHFLLIAYLHLTFLGMATPAAWWMFGKAGWLPTQGPAFRRWSTTFAIGFLSTEALLLAMGLGLAKAWLVKGLLAGAALMLAGVAGVLVAQLADAFQTLPKVKENIQTVELPVAAGEKTDHGE